MDFTASMSKSFISKKAWRMHLQRCARNQGAIPDVTWSSWDGVHFLDSSMYGAVLDAGGQNSIGNTWMLQLLLSSACTVLRPPSSAPIARRLGVGKGLEEAMAGTADSNWLRRCSKPYNMLCKGTGRSLSQVAVAQGLTVYRSACGGWLLLYHLGEKFVFFFFPFTLFKLSWSWQSWPWRRPWVFLLLPFQFCSPVLSGMGGQAAVLLGCLLGLTHQIK